MKVGSSANRPPPPPCAELDRGPLQRGLPVLENRDPGGRHHPYTSSLNPVELCPLAWFALLDRHPRRGEMAHRLGDRARTDPAPFRERCGAVAVGVKSRLVV